MLVLTTFLFTAALTLAQIFNAEPPQRIDVDCANVGALERALKYAKRFREVDIFIHRVCEGNFVIDTDGVTLRAAAEGSGLAAPEGDPGFRPVLEIVDAKASLRGLVVQGGVVGVLVRGGDAEVLLFDVDVRDSIGAIAEKGALLRLLDSTFRDGQIGIVADSGSTINLQNVLVSHQDVGVIIDDRSTAALNDTTIENSREGGLVVRRRSDVNVLGGVYRENGDVHINADDWSSIRLLNEVTIGSETDTTRFSLGVIRYATIASFSSPFIYGDVSALIGGSIRMGNTVLDGELSAVQFSTAFVRNAEITGTVFCADGSNAICRQTTTAGSVDCPSPTCGSAAAGEANPYGLSVFEVPAIEVPPLERRPVSRSRFERDRRPHVRREAPASDPD